MHHISRLATSKSEYVLYIAWCPYSNHDNHSRAFNFGEFVNGKAQQPIPPAIKSDEPKFSAFTDYCHDLCLKLLYLLGVGLNVSDLARLRWKC